jgi:Reverse transcriptase (RNA-dependent DNA polymerase)
MDKEPSLYTRILHSRLQILAVYVDDILVAASHVCAVEEIKKPLSKTFDITDMGVASIIFGWQIEIESTCIRIHQENYLDKILERFQQTGCRPASTPLSLGSLMHSTNQLVNVSIPDNPFCSAVGAILYLATSTCPDLLLVVSVLSRFLVSPCQRHQVLLNRVFCCVISTRQLGLMFPLGCENINPAIVCYSDADLGGPGINCISLNQTPCCRSVLGCTIAKNCCLVLYRSKQQSQVARSLMQAEILSAGDCLSDLQYLLSLTQNLNFINSKIEFYFDNLNTVNSFRGSLLRQRTRHTLINMGLISEIIEKHNIVVHHIRGNKNLANLFTKLVCYERYYELLGCFNVLVSSSSKSIRNGGDCEASVKSKDKIYN